ncbi:MAG: hypothetical protein K2M30_04475 [Desulfovibrionaceae bacterium]|nr:hypothetical protein [Desulfovibrionaceae bacterium]
MLSTEEIESLLVFTSVLLQGKKYRKVIAIGKAFEKLEIYSPSMLRMYGYACIEAGYGKEALRVFSLYPEQELTQQELQLFILLKATALWSIKNKKSAFLEIKKFISLRA